MKEDSLITYRTLAKIAFDRLSEEMKKDPDFNRTKYCEMNNLNYSTFTKFMMVDPSSQKGRKRVWKSFLPELLKSIGIDVQLEHTVYYYSVKSGIDELIK